MKAKILISMVLLTSLASLGAALADPPARDRSPYERGYYSGSRDDFDFEGGRWGRDLRFSDETPSFFPDGRRVAFASDRDGRERELYIRDIARGGPVIRLTNNRFDDWAPSVSPDGRWIAFLSNRDGRAGLFTMRADGRDVECLVPGVRQGLASPVWSPDGRYVAFTARQGGGSALLRIRADGKGKVERLGGWAD